MKKVLFLSLIFYLILLIQESFLPHFNIRGVVPNLVLIFVCLFSFFEKSKKRDEKYGIILVIIVGFFLDIFSVSFFGRFILILTAIYFLTRKTLSYFRDIPPKYSIFYFLLLFALSLILFEFLGALSFHYSLPNLHDLLIKIIYNLIIATIIFYLYLGTKTIWAKHYKYKYEFSKI